MTDEYMIMDEKIIEKKLRGSNTRLIGKKTLNSSFSFGQIAALTCFLLSQSNFMLVLVSDFITINMTCLDPHPLGE